MARVMDFTHDDSGSHQVRSPKLLPIKKQQRATADDDEDVLVAEAEDPDEDEAEDGAPPEEEESAPQPEPEPDEDEESEEDGEPGEEPEPTAKAAKKRDHLKSEMDRLVAESQRAAQLETRLHEQERRAAQAELGAIKSYAALKQRDFEITRKELDEAIELGEVSKQSELRDKYHDLRTELGQMAAYIQRQEQVLSQPAPPPPPNPRAVAWAKKQKWWGKDKGLTGAAFAIDEDLINEGISPYSDVFYQELDKRLKPYMGRPSQRRQAVAAVSTRTAPGASRRAVKLDADQLDMARRLNVPPAEYAKYVNI